jgi:hypothetical protein
MPPNSQKWKEPRSEPGRRITSTGIASAKFVSDDPRYATLLPPLLGRLPALDGRPIRLSRAEGLRDGARAVHAGSFLRERSIAFNCRAREFPRIFVHELFHFVWLRLGNHQRHSYEDVLCEERDRAARGELGWSAEWRKQKLTRQDVLTRSRSWREYCCESFCDTAAWIYSGVRNHPEFTLAGRHRHRRRVWFARIAGGPLLI